MSSRKRPLAASEGCHLKSAPAATDERERLASLLPREDIQKKLGGSTGDVLAASALFPLSECPQVPHERPGIGRLRTGHDDVDKTAVLSACHKYRYQLTRHVNSGGKMFGFIGVNPSTADARVEDHTTKKWLGFVQRWGGKGYHTVNLFAFRATNVEELANVTDPVGAENDRYIDDFIRTCDVLVPCWGSLAKVPKQHRERAADVLSRLRKSGKPVHHLGLTRGGQPKHPLLLPYNAELRRFISGS